MGNALKLFKQVINVIIFILAVFLLFLLTNNYFNILKSSKSLISDDSVLYQQYNETDTPIVSYGKLVSTLFYELEYDVQIDGLLINKYEHNESMIDSYNIQENDYLCSYLYDNNGNLSRVIYTSVSN